MTKKKFIIFSIFLILLISEFFSFIYFRVISNDFSNLALYSEKRKSALSYKYFDNIGLVLPKIINKKDLVFTHFTKEFTDRFIFRDILGLGVGFPDDGIDERKYKAVAIGDSFTRGVGSINNLKNGWVELVEEKNKDIDIINLGHFGAGVNDQKYGYDKIKKFINHDIVIYNFLSIYDYIDNVSDLQYSFYIEKFYKKFGEEETQKLINDLNIRHGYKHHLEYLLKNKIKSYTVYFTLKIADYLILKDLLPAKKFIYNIPKAEVRLNIVEDELFKFYELKNKYKMNCKEKYCYYEYFENNKEIFNEAILNKIILNSANKINQFYQESLTSNKKFIFVLHPNAGHFFPNQTIFDNSKIDKKLIKLLNPKIKVIDVSNKLFEIHRNNKEKIYFYKYDGHYNVEGYKTVSTIISKELSYLLE